MLKNDHKNRKKDEKMTKKRSFLPPKWGYKIPYQAGTRTLFCLKNNEKFIKSVKNHVFIAKC